MVSGGCLHFVEFATITTRITGLPVFSHCFNKGSESVVLAVALEEFSWITAL
jgi:hypothetical protein